MISYHGLVIICLLTTYKNLQPSFELLLLCLSQYNINIATLDMNCFYYHDEEQLHASEGWTESDDC
jgi:hypothetical protein